MKTRRHQLVPAEKTLVVNVYDYFVKEAEAGRNNGRDSRQRTADATLFGVSTVQRVLAARNVDPGTNFIQNVPSARGRKKSYNESELNVIVREYVVDQNKACKPVTSQLVCDHVETVLGQQINARTMRTWLNDMGFKHLRGQNRHYLAESAGNVAFRATYLQKREANRGTRGNPILPEVVLDESYCNVHHVTGKTWLTEDKVRFSKSGRGARICIVGAIIFAHQGAILQGDFVKDSLIHWPSTKKPGDGGGDDYHGNFDSVLFEKWFTRMCVSLQVYGSCIIHMDGASYHKRQEHPAPNRKTLKTNIQEWLTDNGIAYDPKAFIPQLLELVKEHKPKPVSAAQRIASDHGHFVLYTPPYHPELQPIELVWGFVKNKIARRPADNITDLSTKLTTPFAEVHSKHLCKYYKRVLKFERKYLAALEDCEIVEEDDDDADPEDNEA